MILFGILKLPTSLLLDFKIFLGFIDSFGFPLRITTFFFIKTFSSELREPHGKLGRRSKGTGVDGGHQENKAL